jgi:hypothetical protein
MMAQPVRNARQVAQQRYQQHQYLRLLKEYQQPPQITRIFPENNTSVNEPDVSWYDFVSDLTAIVNQRQEILEHTIRMRQENARTQEVVSRVLAHNYPASSSSDHDEQIDPEATILMVAAIKPPQRSHESIATGPSIKAMLNDAIERYQSLYHALPTHLRLSSYNHLIFCLEHAGEIPTAHVNEYGSFQLIADVHQDDNTIVCEEYA